MPYYEPTSTGVYDIYIIVCRVPPKAAGLQVFSKWHVAFHGTKDISVSKILEAGDLLMPGKSLFEKKIKYI